MGVLSNLRGFRGSTPSGQDDRLPTSNGSASVSSPKKKWATFLPVFVALIVLSELAFLGRLDMAKNAALLVDSWADSLFYKSVDYSGEELGIDRSCEEEWLEREDAVVYSRDFDKDPVLVAGGDKGGCILVQSYCEEVSRIERIELIVVTALTDSILGLGSAVVSSVADQEFKACAVGCQFGFSHSKPVDATFGLIQQHGVASVHRSMESAQYYPENNVATARGRGYQVVMTTSLSSDVPVGYFSWAEYDIMAPVQPKTEKALAAAFISNCAARNFRLQALTALEKLKIPIDSYGSCHRNHNGRVVDKVKTLKGYKFSLAFENSNEEDYVTEKFFQSLVAGTVPVVVGAPNIEEFAPAPGSILHIKELEDVEKVAKTMYHLAEKPDAYNHSLRWKYEGPSDSFKALVDMAAVHSSCRLCLHLATMIHEKEENSPEFRKRPCKCTKGSETVYHLYVRERGRFYTESIFLRSGNLTLEALETEVLKKFRPMKHIPIWKEERPESIRGGDELKIYRIYPVGLTQRQALYTFKFDGDAGFQKYLETKPCAKLEVIFV